MPFAGMQSAVSGSPSQASLLSAPRMTTSLLGSARSPRAVTRVSRAAVLRGVEEKHVPVPREVRIRLQPDEPACQLRVDAVAQIEEGSRQQPPVLDDSHDAVHLPDQHPVAGQEGERARLLQAGHDQLVDQPALLDLEGRDLLATGPAVEDELAQGAADEGDRHDRDPGGGGDRRRAPTRPSQKS
jgi:hypothetical protein